MRSRLSQTVYQNAKSIDLPATVPVKFPNGYNDDRKVTWKDADIKAIDLTKVGDYEVAGTVDDGSSSALPSSLSTWLPTRTVPPLRSLSLSRWSVGLKAGDQDHHFSLFRGDLVTGRRQAQRRRSRR